MSRGDRSSGLLAAVLGLIALVMLGLAYTRAEQPAPGVGYCPGCGDVSPSAVATPAAP